MKLKKSGKIVFVFSILATVSLLVSQNFAFAQPERPPRPRHVEKQPPLPPRPPVGMQVLPLIITPDYVPPKMQVLPLIITPDYVPPKMQVLPNIVITNNPFTPPSSRVGPDFKGTNNASQGRYQPSTSKGGKEDSLLLKSSKPTPAASGSDGNFLQKITAWAAHYVNIISGPQQPNAYVTENHPLLEQWAYDANKILSNDSAGKRLLAILDLPTFGGMTSWARANVRANEQGLGWLDAKRVKPAINVGMAVLDWGSLPIIAAYALPALGYGTAPELCSLNTANILKSVINSSMLSNYMEIQPTEYLMGYIPYGFNSPILVYTGAADKVILTLVGIVDAQAFTLVALTQHQATLEYQKYNRSSEKIYIPYLNRSLYMSNGSMYDGQTNQAIGTEKNFKTILFFNDLLPAWLQRQLAR